MIPIWALLTIGGGFVLFLLGSAGIKISIDCFLACRPCRWCGMKREQVEIWNDGSWSSDEESSQGEYLPVNGNSSESCDTSDE